MWSEKEKGFYLVGGAHDTHERGHNRVTSRSPPVVFKPFTYWSRISIYNLCLCFKPSSLSLRQEAIRIAAYEPCAVTSDTRPLSRGFCPPGTGGRAGWPAPFIKLPARTRQTDDPSVLQSDLRFRDNNVSAAPRFRGKSSSLEGDSAWLCCCLFASVQPAAEERGRVTSFPFLMCA